MVPELGSSGKAVVQVVPHSSAHWRPGEASVWPSFSSGPHPASVCPHLHPHMKGYLLLCKRCLGAMNGNDVMAVVEIDTIPVRSCHLSEVRDKFGKACRWCNNELTQLSGSTFCREVGTEGREMISSEKLEARKPQEHGVSIHSCMAPEWGHSLLGHDAIWAVWCWPLLSKLCSWEPSASIHKRNVAAHSLSITCIKCGLCMCQVTTNRTKPYVKLGTSHHLWGWPHLTQCHLSPV